MANLGLKENWKQFSLLVLVNAFVGGMIGLERSLLPQLAETQFGIVGNSAILSFITAFGITKALANYLTGRLANAIGRKNLLVIGWIFAIPVPLILIYAPNWNWVIFANVLLGINQGFTWSSTVVMKIDLVGDKNRGLAMGINEFAGYLAVGLTAFFAGLVAHKYGLLPYPFYIGLVFAILGLFISIVFINDTKKHVEQEEQSNKNENLQNIFWETSFKNKTLSAVTQAGFVNNLNDGMIWGLLPVFLFSLNFETKEIALLAGIYPTVWGLAQLITGKLGDKFSKKRILFWGMLLQGLAIVWLPFQADYLMLLLITLFLGIGTALVYPNFLSAIADNTSPNQRAESIGTFRLWRDLGYAFGAVFSGIVADLFGVVYAIFWVGIFTIASALVIKLRMKN